MKVKAVRKICTKQKPKETSFKEHEQTIRKGEVGPIQPVSFYHLYFHFCILPQAEDNRAQKLLIVIMNASIMSRSLVLNTPKSSKPGLEVMSDQMLLHPSPAYNQRSVPREH